MFAFTLSKLPINFIFESSKIIVKFEKSVSYSKTGHYNISLLDRYILVDAFDFIFCKIIRMNVDSLIRENFSSLCESKLTCRPSLVRYLYYFLNRKKRGRN